MLAAIDNLNVASTIVLLNTLRVEFDRDRDKCKSRRELDNSTRIILPDGREMRVSDRFWSSFSSLHNLGRSTFDYFSHEETFDRITRVRGDAVRLAFEDYGENGGRMLSCTAPGKPLLRLEEVRTLLSEYEGQKISYADGMVTAAFECPFPANFKIGGDEFRTQFHLQMPVDGYGLPAAFLGLLRLICTNGMVAMSPAFKTSFQLGKDSASLILLLERAMTTFNNEEGFHALRQRLDSAAGSWASLNEARRLHTCMATAAACDGMDQSDRAELLAELQRNCGDPLGIYGLSGHDEVSARRARSVPVEATVYDLMNFATETATHHLRSLPARSRVHGWIGETVTQEYDLEGTVSQFPDFKDYFLARITPVQAAASAVAAASN